MNRRSPLFSLSILMVAAAVACRAQELPKAKPFDPFAKRGLSPMAQAPAGRKTAGDVFPEQVIKGGVSGFEYVLLAPGVEYYRARVGDLFGKVNSLHVVRVDFKVADVRPAIHPNSTDASGKPDGKKLRGTSDVAEEYRALVAVNGGFFRWKVLKPCYVQKVDGKLIDSESTRGSGFAFTGKDKLYMGALSEAGLRDYANFLCGDYVLGNGRCCLEGQRNSNGPAPRTLLGLAPGDVLYIFVIDGRQKGFSVGINYWESADLMRWFGCTEGFNLDGGGSTTLCIRKKALKGYRESRTAAVSASRAKAGVQIVNKPSDKRERRVLDHFLILDGDSVPPPAE